MDYDRVRDLLAAVGLAGLVAYLLYRMSVFWLLERFGASTRGRVVRSVEHKGQDGNYFLVTYEFAGRDRRGVVKLRRASQQSQAALREHDLVAVRYWPVFPWISRMVERSLA